jgi:alanyl-tRNA synthetase
MKYTTDDFRKKWLSFWKSKNHTIIPSAGVLPENDPTALFHNSGMHPLVPFLMGEKHPSGVRLANSQKCIRTGDIEEVGDKIHLTFFEMLGNWSLGDFFKKEQITWSYEFLTKVLELPIEKLAVSVFAGDENAPRDDFSATEWEKAGMPKTRIAYLPASENWWAKGDTGPCGPDSEMFFWTGDDPAPESFQETFEDVRWVEIWNDVFMQFNKDENGKLSNLPAQNIDTGMGLERIVAILNGKKSVYETDAFEPILRKISEITNHSEIYQEPLGEMPTHFSGRVIADHLRAATVILADGCAPSNVDAGYILRRLIRRAIRHGRKLGLETNFTTKIAEAVIEKLAPQYPELQKNKAFIFDELDREEDQFRKTCEKGEREFEKLATHSNGEISGNDAFNLYQTYGFPIEMTVECADEKGLKVDEKAFAKEFEKHQKMSRGTSEKKFSGGLSLEDVKTERRLHTAAHLLLAGLQKFCAPDIQQRGANITAQRLRLDFNYAEKVPVEILTQIEDWINDIIKQDIEIKKEEMTLEKAKEIGATGIFADKYGERVSVYTIGNISCEICGGPHAERTSDLKHFKIKKEQSSSRGVRRIKAILEE